MLSFGADGADFGPGTEVTLRGDDALRKIASGKFLAKVGSNICCGLAPTGVKSRDLKSLDKQKKTRYGAFGADGRTRTGTELSPRGILSPLRLPISPHRHVILIHLAYN